jgi:NAD+ kinase
VSVETHMNRVLVLGDQVEGILPLVEESGLTLVTEDPDVVLTYGGDGLLLGSERDWPGVPKLPLRNSRHGKKCEPHEIQVALERLLSGDLVRAEHLKVRAEAKGHAVVGLNDVMVHNSRPWSSVRCRIWIDGRELETEIVGDGLVVATPFGSTAYYRSITRGIFHAGLGLAFNNSTEPVDHMVLREDAQVRVRITRGPALVVADNDPDTIPLRRGDEVRIRRDESRAVILGLAGPAQHLP